MRLYYGLNVGGYLFNIEAHLDTLIQQFSEKFGRVVFSIDEQ